ncbi:MAG: hypothetical protein CMO81_03165 [Waddliaceae bacterium]|nr:hypothetical protein [Waddliaceae bacterium]
MVRWLKQAFGFSILSLSLWGQNTTTQDQIRAHLLLRDPYTAQDLHRANKEKNSSFSAYLKQKLEIDLALGNEQAAIDTWHSLLEEDPEKALASSCLEKVSWAVLHWNMQGTSVRSRYYAVMMASASGDALGVPTISKALKDRDVTVRVLGARAASFLPHRDLALELLDLLGKEPVERVRHEALQSITRLRLKEAVPVLKERLLHHNGSRNEQILLIQAIAFLSEGVDDSYIHSLLNESSASLRELAVGLIEAFPEKIFLQYLPQLFQDRNPGVRASVLRSSLHFIAESPELKNHMVSLLDDLDPTVALSAAWCLLVLGDERGESYLEKELRSHLASRRYSAAGAIAAAGERGVAIAKRHFNTHSDEFVRSNLSLGLMKQSVSSVEAASIVFNHLQKDEKKWMWEEKWGFRVLVPSTVEHHPLIPQYPHSIDQQVRLSVLGALSVVSPVQAVEATKKFLRSHAWGLSSMAAAQILSEGEVFAVDAVYDLLHDEDHEIQIQAALVLALWQHDVIGVPILLKAYPKLSRFHKERILEALSQLDDEESFQFMIGEIQSPFSTLRLLALSAIQQRLNR